MASRFVELNEAAKILGLTPDQLIEMRSSGDVHGYRDGASWKFKVEEIERVKGELARGSSGNVQVPFKDDLDEFVKPAGMEEDAASILINEEGSKTTSSTIIGKSGEVPLADSDLKLGSDLAIKPDASGTDLTLVAGGSSAALDDEGSEISLDAGPSKKGGSAVDSDVALVPGVGTDSDVKLVPDAGSDKTLKTPPGLGADVLGDSDAKLKPASTGGAGLGSSQALGSGDLDIALDSELALSDDDEMVLGGSGVGSDLTLNPADSGISLSSPTDSGLSLEADSGISLQTPTDSGLSLEEEPLDMGGSSISALELPEDESVELESGAFEAEPVQSLKKDEDFLLTPSDEMFADESDSGSQVIALEDSAAFDQEAAILQGQPALLADTAGLDQQLDALGGGGVAATPISVPTPAYMGPAAVPEAPYSIWNIVGLVVIVMFLSVTGILMSDIVRNMWAWEEGLDVSTSISEGLAGAFGLK